MWAGGTSGVRGLVEPLCPWCPLPPDCSFTCHYRCRALVRLDCSGPPGTGDEDDGSEQELEKDTNVVRDHGDGESGVDIEGWGTAQAGPCQAKAHRAMPREAVLCHATARCAML